MSKSNVPSPEESQFPSRSIDVTATGLRFAPSADRQSDVTARKIRMSSQEELRFQFKGRVVEMFAIDFQVLDQMRASCAVRVDSMHWLPPFQHEVIPDELKDQILIQAREAGIENGWIIRAAVPPARRPDLSL